MRSRVPVRAMVESFLSRSARQAGAFLVGVSFREFLTRVRKHLHLARIEHERSHRARAALTLAPPVSVVPMTASSARSHAFAHVRRPDSESRAWLSALRAP